MCILSEAKKISNSDDHILNHQIVVKVMIDSGLGSVPKISGQDNMFPSPTV